MPVVGESLKACARCAQELPLDQFAMRGDGRGPSSYCRPCQREYTRAYRAKRPEETRKASREWARRNPEKRKAWRDNNPERRKVLELRGAVKRYGLTLEQYQQMVTDQGGRCAICHRHQSDILHGRLHVDHDHDTGAARALLCDLCNGGIGRFRDDALLVYKAYLYLNRFKAPLKGVAS